MSLPERSLSNMIPDASYAIHTVLLPAGAIAVTPIFDLNELTFCTWNLPVSKSCVVWLGSLEPISCFASLYSIFPIPSFIILACMYSLLFWL